MNEKQDPKSPASSIFSVIIGIIVAIAIAAGLMYLLGRMDRFFSRRIPNYERIRIFFGLLLNICLQLLMLIFLIFYLYYLFGNG